MDLQQQAAHSGMKYGRSLSASGSKGHALMALINECRYHAPSLSLSAFVYSGGSITVALVFNVVRDI